MKNKLSDLNDHLFAQLERLGDEDLSSEEIQSEVERSKAVVGLAGAIVENAELVFSAARFQVEHGMREMPAILSLPGNQHGKG